MATTIVLVRHGETDWNRERRWQGHTDRSLNEEGRAQALAVADELADDPFTAVYSSDLLRAHETARIIAERKGLDVTALPGLRETRFGSWEGLRDEEVAHRFPGLDRPHDAEPREEMSARVLEALRRIAETHPDGRVLVVAHGGPLRAVMRHCAHSGHRQPIANCGVIRVAVEDGIFREVD